MFDLPLPDAEDMNDSVYRKYAVFKRRTLRTHHEKVYRFISERWPRVCIANHVEFHRGFIRQESNTAIERPLPHWQYSASDNTKWAVSSYPEMMASNTTVDFIDYPYRHVAVSPHQQRLRLAQNLANGGALDYYLIGRLDNHEDRSGFAGIRDIFHYHAAHEDDYANLTSRATIALLDGAYANRAEFRGWFRFLIEHHFLFDTLRGDAILEQPWHKYDALILPDLQAISDALATQIDNFVASGGVLIAVGQSGFRDAHYEVRAEPVIKSLGIEEVQRIREDMRASYFKFTDKAGFPRFAETNLVYMDGPYVYAQYAEDAACRMHLIPPHNFGPPERCYYDIVTEHPGFITHPFGQGQALYLPWLPGSLFYRQGHTNTTDFCADLLEGIAGLRPIGGNLPPMVEVTVFEKQDSGAQLIHLVNGSGHFGNSFFAPIPMTDLSIVLPWGNTPVEILRQAQDDTTVQPPEIPRQAQDDTEVWGLRQNQAYAYTWENGKLTIQVPHLGLFEAIRVTF
jgi:hypothetical protein